MKRNRTYYPVIFYRMGNSTLISLGLKFSAHKDKFGKLHASKDKVYGIMNTFAAPKGSPLHASHTFHLSPI